MTFSSIVSDCRRKFTLSDLKVHSLNCLADTTPFYGATATPVLKFWWRLPWVSKPGWFPCMLSRLCDPQIQVWCQTCWLYRSAWQPSLVADVSTSILGGLELEPTTVRTSSITLWKFNLNIHCSTGMRISLRLLNTTRRAVLKATTKITSCQVSRGGNVNFESMF